MMKWSTYFSGYNICFNIFATNKEFRTPVLAVLLEDAIELSVSTYKSKEQYKIISGEEKKILNT